MTSDDIHDLSGAYVLDALDDSERSAFEAHCSSCERCVAEVADFRERLGTLVDEVPPPAGLKGRVMAEVAMTPQQPTDDLHGRGDRAAFARRSGALLAAAAAIVAMVAGSYVVGRSGRGSVDSVLAADDAVVTSLDGGPGTVQVIWSDDLDRAVVVASGLVQPGPGLTYQLWYLRPGSVTSAGLFRPDDDGSARVVLDLGRGVGAGWGITVEPDGGSEQPTSEVLYEGEI